MGKALYRKYRPKKLSEVVGQEHITYTLERALGQDRISHAYLFTGPRGVGKTSVARILAHEINGLPYEDDSSHIDIIEIDAASNRRIDEIRELRDKVYVAPTTAKYKVYIIDEVHMLTREAFNALLKTLEEPPAHVVFILATTDAHKLPETIISRTQRFSFKPVDKQNVVDHLRQIAKQEKITIDDEALKLLAEHGEGSFRDSIGLLDQTSNYGDKLAAADVQQLLGIPPDAAIDSLQSNLNKGELAAVANSLAELYGQGFQAVAVAQALGERLRSQLLDGQQSLGAEAAFDLLTRLVEVPNGYDPERLLEIVLLRAVPRQSASNASPLPVATTLPTVPEVAPEEAPAVPTEKPQSPAAAAKSALKSDAGNGVNKDSWQQVLSTLKQRHNTLYGVVRMAQPEFSTDGNVLLSFSFAFHQKRVNETGNRQILAKIIEEVTGQAVTIECIVDEKAKPLKVAASPKPAAAEADLSAISNIFGGGELLES